MIFKKHKKQEVINKDLHHIAFIMDGNGRWATAKHLPRTAGHVAGAKAFRRVVEYCGDIGISYVTVYAFSTENWSRPQDEVDRIMKLLDEYIDEASNVVEKYDLRVIFVGDRAPLSEDIKIKMAALEKKSEIYHRVLNIALNYGSRSEIVHAVNELIAEGKSEITEDDINAHLYTKLSPPPDLIVRTAGELRLSNFLLWQAAYAEFYFTDTLWPDMTERDIDKAVEEFHKRKRKYGGLG